MQANRRHAGSDLDAAWLVAVEFVTAVALYGGLGWLADRWLGTGHVLLFVGLIVGMVLGIYLMMKKLEHAENEVAARKQAARAQR